MLISFSIENFRSFREEQTLSMVASSRFADHPGHLLAIPDSDEQGLAVAAIYGANASGKSNFIKALARLCELVHRGTAEGDWVGTDPFRLDPACSKAPTTFKVQFAHEGKAFSYGCRLLKDRVESEWLSLLRNDRETIVYERATDALGKVTVEVGPGLDVGEAGPASTKMRNLATLGGPPRQLFLTTIRQIIGESGMGDVLGTAVRWFTAGIKVIEPESRFGTLAGLLESDVEFREFASGFLAKAGTGIARLKVDSTRMERDLLARFPSLASGVDHAKAKGHDRFPVGEGQEFVLSQEPDEGAILKSIEAEHMGVDGSEVAMPFHQESDGTRRLTHLLPAIHTAQSAPNLYVIDEIDRSLHPLLAKGFVRGFLEWCAGRGSQLIFTTHDTTFLDTGLLRRDEIWFTRKNVPPGSTELYSLCDFRARNDLKLDKAYLEGRFGAIPPMEVEMPEWVQRIMGDLKPGAVASAEPGKA